MLNVNELQRVTGIAGIGNINFCKNSLFLPPVEHASDALEYPEHYLIGNSFSS